MWGSREAPPRISVMPCQAGGANSATRRIRPPRIPALIVEPESNPSQDCISDAEAARWLPPVLRRLSDMIGPEPILRMIEEAGGRTIFIPIRPRENSLIVKLVGMLAAERIAVEFGGLKISVPPSHLSGPAMRQRKGMALLREGKSLSTVAFELRAARSTVQAWRRKL